MSSSMRGQIIRVNKDAVPPREHIEDILKAYDTCLSMCFIDEDKLSTFKVGETIKSLDEAMNLFELTKGKSVIAWFGKCDEAYTEDDVQPFMSMNGDIAVFLDAPFNDYSHPENPDTKHSRAFYAFHEYFQPEIESSAELADNDLEKVVNSLRGNAFKRKMDKELLKEGGSCLVFANTKTGEINQWCTNTTAVTGNWGWTSEESPGSESEGTEEVVATKVEPVKATSLLDKLKASTATKPTDNNVKNLAQGGAPVSPIASDLKAGTATMTTSTVILWKPEIEDPLWKKNWSNKKIKARYYERCGQLPTDWVNGAECRVLPKGNYRPKGFEALQVIHTPQPPAPAQTATGSPSSKAQEPGSPAKKPEETFPDAATRLPLLSKQAHERLDGFLKDKSVKKFLDNSSINVMDPDIATKIEKRVPHLEEQRGMKPGETLTWPIEVYEALASECPEEAAILLLNRAGQMISMQRAIGGLSARLHKASSDVIRLKALYEPENLSAEEQVVANKPAADKAAAPAASTPAPAAASGRRIR